MSGYSLYSIFYCSSLEVKLGVNLIANDKFVSINYKYSLQEVQQKMKNKYISNEGFIEVHMHTLGLPVNSSNCTCI